MSAIELREELNAPELQIWNNAAFDNGDSEDSYAIRTCWPNLPPDCVHESFDSDCSKENYIPPSVFSSLQSSINVQEKPPKVGFEAPSAKAKTVTIMHCTDQHKKREDRNIDAEIEEVEKQINRLSARLDSLRLQKAEQTARNISLRGRIVPAKFMEPQKKTVKNHHDIADALFPSAKSKINRRGVSLGPAEIFSVKTKTETATPLQSAQNRRKSCFWKLPDIDEGKVVPKGRERTSLSLSPRSRKAALEVGAVKKQAATTVGSKRPVKKEEGILSSIQPKRLFKDGEKSVGLKKPLKPGRMVASKYNQISKTVAGEKDARKRSLPENEVEYKNRSEKRRASDEKEENVKSESRVKRRWEIPSQVVVYKSEETPVGKELPRIRTLRLTAESPRDSGAAKRVAEMEGKERYFAFSQSLRFEGED
ncbi:PREDICTED: uncharacterized protein LOC104804065 [Tarenaya hassleriana]|uniref:uncharacterized protein LOC104804065 n=1 Tax=Tarenaya hassleriana TaxID=28532 RepID=UPI00053C4CEB|nr:PREDICTED: uncharacterized protein LOC104804065 [Tarenaya hassleriana]